MRGIVINSGHNIGEAHEESDDHDEAQEEGDDE
jgi:hypothetical protein